MKNLAILFLLVVILCSCKPGYFTPGLQSRGVFTGYDHDTCSFCGGLKITILNDTSKNAPAFYRVDTTITRLHFTGNTEFPFYCQLDWHLRPGNNPGNYIIITKIR